MNTVRRESQECEYICPSDADVREVSSPNVLTWNQAWSLKNFLSVKPVKLITFGPVCDPTSGHNKWGWETQTFFLSHLSFHFIFTIFIQRGKVTGWPFNVILILSLRWTQEPAGIDDETTTATAKYGNIIFWDFDFLMMRATVMLVMWTYSFHY